MKDVHSYSTDSNERRTIYLILVIPSLVFTWIFTFCLEWVLTTFPSLTVPWWVELPSFATFYGLCFIVFDRWLWKNSYTEKLGLVKIPDFSGTWTGILRSSYDKFQKEYTMKLKISQTWSEIGIYMEANNSTSYSIMACVFTKNPLSSELHYEYHNEPKMDAAQAMSQHYGTGRLVMDQSAEVITGNYYNCGRDRLTWGKCTLKKEQTSLES